MSGVLILLAMAVFVALMMTRVLATPLALLALSVVIGFLLGVPWIGGTAANTILGGIIAAGAATLAPTMVTVIFGSWLGAVMDETGIAQTLVRKAVELGGDRPYAVAFAVWFVSIFVGTVTGSAPAAILVGLIGIPAMLAAGVPRTVAASTVVIGLWCGNPLQLQTWKYLSQAMNVPQADVVGYMVRFLPIVLAAGVLFLFVQSRVSGRVYTWAVSAPRAQPVRHAPWYSLITPAIPIGLVLGSAALGISIDVIPALIIGIVYGVLTTKPREFNNVMLRTAYKGLELAAAPTYLFIVIGMLLTAVRMPGVVPALHPLVSAIAPHNPWVYALGFGLLAPLTLYRGPLNIVGMGVGIAGVLLALGTYPALLVLGTFASQSGLIGVSDPTGTQTVWSAEYAGVRPEDVMRQTLPFTWAAAFAGVILAVLLYLH